MSLYDIFEISGSALAAQSVRLNTTASNIANADSVASSENQTYRARHPVFEAVLQGMRSEQDASAGVRVAGIVESKAAPIARYQPENPLADENGYVYSPNISVVEEMANMISASRNYQANVQVANMTKYLLTRTLTLGQ